MLSKSQPGKLQRRPERNDRALGRFEDPNKTQGSRPGKPQVIVWPWKTRKWPDIKAKMADEIHSIADMDSRIVALGTIMHSGIGRLRTRQIMDAINMYYNDDQYAKGRVPQDIFLSQILPQMQKLVLLGPKTFKRTEVYIPAPGMSANIVLNRVQVATILSCMWFNLFQYNYVSKGPVGIRDLSIPSITHIFTEQNIFALQCIINYFARVNEYMTDPDEDIRNTFSAGNIIVKRSVLTATPDWPSSTKPICQIALGEERLDDAPTKMCIVNAHEYIGGDCMFKGILSQEEVILLTRPECLVATLICAGLNDNETITIIGAEKISQYIGYGSSIRFDGNYIDTAPKGYNKECTEVITQTAMIFMDASRRTARVSQFIDDFERDLNKAYCGFSSLKFSKAGEYLAGGNWTYAFNGANMQIKFIQQVLAASEADKSLVYYPNGRDFEAIVMPFIDWLMRAELTVGELFKLYVEMLQEIRGAKNIRMSDIDVFNYISEIYE